MRQTFDYKTFTFDDSDDLELWCKTYEYWKIEGIWGTPKGIHVLCSVRKEQ